MLRVLQSGSLFFIALALHCTSAFAQIEQVARMELMLPDQPQERFAAVSLQEDGLMLYRRVFGQEEDQLELFKVDTTFRETWKGAVPLEKELSVLKVLPLAGRLYLILRTKNYVGGDFKVIEVLVNSGEFVTHVIRNLIPFAPTTFAVTQRAVLIGGYYNYRPLVLFYDLKKQESRVLPGFFNSPGELNQMKTYEDGTIDVIVSARSLEKRKSLWIRNYGDNGELIKTTIIQPSEDKNLLFGRSVKLPNGQQIVAGVYGRYTEYSRGIFMATINDIGEYNIAYYNFATLQNFFSYMKARQQKRVKERIERRTIKGKRLKFNYRFLIQDIVPYKGQYIMAGEAFYPHYVYPTSSTNYYRPLGSYNVPGSLGMPIFRNEMVFDGYQYTHAVVIGFDSNGRIKWDNSFEINDIRTMDLGQYVKIQPDQERIVMMYLFKNSLRTKIIRDNQVLEGKSVDTIRNKLQFEKVEVPDIESEQLDHWYGKYFYAYGIQRLSNNFGQSRKIFFVSKITYR